MLSLPYAVYWLTFASALLMSATPMAVLVGGLVGAKLSPSASLATLPIAAMVIGLASFIYFANRLLNHWGYKKLFHIATSISLLANTIAIIALKFELFSLWLIAMALIGIAGACIQQMRFVATTFVQSKTSTQSKTSLIPIALSVFMLGGILAAVLGPELAMLQLTDKIPKYSSGFAIMSALQVLATIIIYVLPNQPFCLPAFNHLTQSPPR